MQIGTQTGISLGAGHLRQRLLAGDTCLLKYYKKLIAPTNYQQNLSSLKLTQKTHVSSRADTKSPISSELVTFSKGSSQEIGLFIIFFHYKYLYS